MPREKEKLTMGICRKCGKKSILVHSKSDGLCFKCSDEVIRAEVETQVRSLNSLVASVIPDQTFSILGVAYWNTLKSRVSDGFGKLIFSALISSIALSLPKEHHIGVLGVSDEKLYVIDFGMVTGESIAPKELREAIVRQRHGQKAPLLDSAPLKTLTASCNAQKGVLSIKGAMSIKATFPKCYTDNNVLRATEISEAIQKAQD